MKTVRKQIRLCLRASCRVCRVGQWYWNFCLAKVPRVRAPVQHNLKSNGVTALSAKLIRLESMWDKSLAGYSGFAAPHRIRSDSTFPYTIWLYQITPICVGFCSYFGKKQECFNASLASITSNLIEHPDHTNLCYKKLYLPDFSWIILKPHVFL